MTQHEDEARGRGHADQLREDYLTSDPQRLLAAYRDLQSRVASGNAATRAGLARAERDGKALRESEATLRRMLGSRTAALEASRKEILRLKADLAHVRASRSLRLGRAILAPLHALPRRQQKPEQGPDWPTAAPKVPIGPDVAPADGSGLTTQSAKPASAMTLTELQDYFASTPTSQSLSWLVFRQWFRHGMVREPARLIEQHPELVEGLEPRERRTADRIVGTARLQEQSIPVPARSQGEAYLPEPGRVMYCTHSTPAYSSNGYSTRTHGVARGLTDAGSDVVVVARVGYPWDSTVDRPKPKARRAVSVLDGVRYIHVPGADLNTTPPDRYLQVAVDAYVREARLNRPELIQAASNYLTALPALVAARRLGVPFVYEVRGLWEVTEASSKEDWEESDRYRLAVELESLVAREADCVLAITSEVAEVLERRGVDRARIIIAPNAVDPTMFLPLPRDAAFAVSRKIRTDAPVIGFAGSVVDYEGLDLLLDASVLLSARGIDHQVVIAGSGPAVDALKAQRAASGARNVLFLGRLPMADMPRLMSTFDIMPCPRHSLPVTELVSPLKPLEAFGCAKAVVLTDLAPHRTLAGPAGERALLVNDGDAGALADALERLIKEPDLRAALGRSARLWALDERTWAAVGNVMREAHRTARHHHQAATDTSDVGLSDLRVGIIADEFTTATLAPSVHLVRLGRGSWREQVANEDLDLLFVESAWKGNDGGWHRGVGYYSDEESADVRELLSKCREKGIPSVFWNKEDPVHFARFRRIAALCDHVFTTDAGMIEPYLATQGGSLRTASALPFYAQPAIHNPLPSERPYEPTVAYAGTYYGERYSERSNQLEGLLEAAVEVGLTVYDRQLGVPDSPYHFPGKYAANVRGVLPYDEVIRSYRTHLAHINVNSVTDSPTMFSRRVVEVAACGGLVLSGPGRGIQESLGDAIPATSDSALWRAYLHAWASSPTERVREQWLQMRTVFRSHTIDTALALVARTAGIPVRIEVMPSYGVLVDAGDTDAIDSLSAQSLRPTVVYVIGDRAQAMARLTPLGVEVRGADEAGGPEPTWLGRWTGGLGRTYAEDLLMASRFGAWERITARVATDVDRGAPLIRRTSTPADRSGFVHASRVSSLTGLDAALEDAPANGVEWLLAPGATTVRTPQAGKARPLGVDARPQRVLIAGHDLKFAAGLMSDLEGRGHNVTIDQWQGHNQHDEERSSALLADADVVFCEWGLGNLVWYSNHVTDRQRLVTRIHLQEIHLPYLARARHEAVNAYMFVGELIRQAAVTSHGVPPERAFVVPNYVDVAGLWRPKSPGSEHHLGLVGIVPQRKRLDLALDVLERLLREDPRYRLFVKGALPSDYPWMTQRPEEMQWYQRHFKRADRMNERWPGCIQFDGFGDDMAEWYTKIGVALSVSDFESFHFTIADGAASGALPASLAWDGADLIYPREWLSPTIAHMADRILRTHPNASDLHRTVVARFGAATVLTKIRNTTLGAHYDS